MQNNHFYKLVSVFVLLLSCNVYAAEDKPAKPEVLRLLTPASVPKPEPVPEKVVEVPQVVEKVVTKVVEVPQIVEKVVTKVVYKKTKQRPHTPISSGKANQYEYKNSKNTKAEYIYWESVVKLNNKEAYDAYLKEYEHGFFKSLAEAMKQKLSKEELNTSKPQ